MISAHDLESKCALHPRIVIDPKVLWQFSRTNGKKQLERLKDFEYEKSFAKEGDGVSYIDYFNDVLGYLPVGKKANDYFRLLCEVIAKNIDNEDISVRIKYIWMREKLKNCEYFEKYKTIFKGIVSNRKRRNNKENII